jgi:hypothetical protein
MKKLTIGLLILTTALLVHARLTKLWTYQELHDQADLVVIAKHISTTNTTEQANLPNIAPDVHVIGLSSEFDVEAVMKGDASLKKLTLHHYRLAPHPENETMANGPSLASFEADHYNTRYLLFLHLEPDGRYAPVSGQTDPDHVSIIRLDGNAL